MTNVNDGGTPAQKKWAAIFGNGYNSSAGIAKLFVLPVEDGLNGWQPGDFMKLNTGFGPTVAPDPLAGLPNGLGTPTLIDVDRNGTADIAYAGDLFRQSVPLQRFECEPGAVDRDEAVPGDLHERNDDAQPITTQPYVFKHPTLPGFIVDLRDRQLRDRDSMACRRRFSPSTASGIAARPRRRPPTATRRRRGWCARRSRTSWMARPTASRSCAIVSANPVDYVPDAGAVHGVLRLVLRLHDDSGRC